MEAPKVPAPAPSAKPAHSLVFQRVILLLQIGVVLFLSALLMSQGKFPGISLIAILVFALFLWQARDRVFLLNFAPFLLLLATYDSLRGMADTLGLASLHITDLIDWERAMFAGHIPSHVFQQALGDQPFTGALDIVANGFYMSHFLVPVVVAVLLWQFRRNRYWPFLLGLTVLSYSGFLTYVFFPAAPPWWATFYGYLPDQPVYLTHSVITMENILAGANPVAAMPSLHTAYPVYVSLFCVFVWGRKALFTLILPLGVALSSIYLGHHYVVDVVAGIVYAVASVGVAVWLSRAHIVPGWLAKAYRNVNAMIGREGPLSK
jgi:membrane-associated phospholipid phosphatase